VSALSAHQNERIQALIGQNASSTDRNSTFLGFLKGVLANCPVSVAQLELQARTAMLLGERQSITHSKPFKRAKKALGIRSIRAGFGPAGEWFWTMQQQPDSEIHEPAGHVSTNQPPAIIYRAEFKLPTNAVEHWCPETMD
jgi:hypothetical protein